MRIAVDGVQKSFFDNEQFIELEGLLRPQQAEILAAEARSIVCERLRIPVAAYSLQSDRKIFGAGRGLWRDRETFQRLSCHSGLAVIAADLFRRRPLRIAYDQLWVPRRMGRIGASFYPQMLAKETVTLEDLSSIQGLVGGLMICLEGEEEVDDEPHNPMVGEKLDPFPRIKGSGIYFSAETPLDLSFINKESTNSYLLIAYASLQAVYVHCPGDPNTHDLKDDGFAFGDSLRQEIHPLVVR